MKNFKIEFAVLAMKNGQVVKATEVATVSATDKKAAYSQAKIQGICHWSQILLIQEIN